MNIITFVIFDNLSLHRLGCKLKTLPSLKVFWQYKYIKHGEIKGYVEVLTPSTTEVNLFGNKVVVIVKKSH